MKSDPKLTSGLNVLWIRFFLVAVYATMCVRDHARPAFHKALGIDIEFYDEQVLKITSEISKQVFPIEIDLQNPRWKRGTYKLRIALGKLELAKRKGGISGFLGIVSYGTSALFAFVGLYTIPVKKNVVPDSPCLQPIY
jgi:magnesium-protoporphyrin IX monomethyl ester (oxidative) cyclase